MPLMGHAIRGVGSSGAVGAVRALISRFFVSGAWIAALVGMYVAVGDMATKRMRVPLRSPALYVEMALLAAAMVCVFRYVERWIRAASREGCIEPTATRCWGWLRFRYQLTLKGVGHDALLIAACWSPYAVLLFPEVISWDAGDQLAQFFGVSAFGMPAGQIWDHHPFLDTYLWGGASALGYKLTGSYIPGLTVLLILQMLVGAFVIAHAMAYAVSRLNAPVRLARIVTVFFCVFPLFPIAFLSLYKDYTHIVFFIPWCIMFTELVRTRLERLKTPWFVAVFLVLSVVASMTKKTGMYIVLFCLLVLLLMKAAARLKAIIVVLLAAITLLSSVLPSALLFKPLGIVENNDTFAAVVPMNMVARVAHDHPQDVTPQERQIVEDFIGLDWKTIGERYNPYSSDAITVFSPMQRKVSLARFMRVWLSIGLRHPKTYLDSFFAQTSGWVAFQEPAVRSKDNSTMVPNVMFSPYATPRAITRVNKDTFGTLIDGEPFSGGAIAISGERQRSVLAWIQWLVSIPVLNVLFYGVTWLVLPFFLLYMVYRRRRTGRPWQGVFVLVPLVVSALTLFLYAVSGSDYMHYMFHTVALGPLYLLGMQSEGFRARLALR